MQDGQKGDGDAGLVPYIGSEASKYVHRDTASRLCQEYFQWAWNAGMLRLMQSSAFCLSQRKCVTQAPLAGGACSCCEGAVCLRSLQLWLNCQVCRYSLQVMSTGSVCRLDLQLWPQGKVCQKGLHSVQVMAEGVVNRSGLQLWSKGTAVCRYGLQARSAGAIYRQGLHGFVWGLQTPSTGKACAWCQSVPSRCHVQRGCLQRYQHGVVDRHNL